MKTSFHHRHCIYGVDNNWAMSNALIEAGGQEEQLQMCLSVYVCVSISLILNSDKNFVI